MTRAITLFKESVGVHLKVLSTQYSTNFCFKDQWRDERTIILGSVVSGGEMCYIQMRQSYTFMLASTK